MYRAFLFFVCLMFLSGCASSEVFKHYGVETSGTEGPEMKMVGSVEIWKHGKPKKGYEVIGVVKDTRNSALIYLTTLDSDVAEQVKEKGGDGAYRVEYGLVPDGQTNPTLVTNSVGGASYSYVKAPVVKYARSSKYEVFKYKK